MIMCLEQYVNKNGGGSSMGTSTTLHGERVLTLDLRDSTDR
jgi:hypothetical protein